MSVTAAQRRSDFGRTKNTVDSRRDETAVRGGESARRHFATGHVACFQTAAYSQRSQQGGLVLLQVEHAGVLLTHLASSDNQATVKSASGNAQSKQSTYCQVRKSFLRHYVRLGKTHFGYIPGAERIADQLTKVQPTARLKEHRAAILDRPSDTFDE